MFFLPLYSIQGGGDGDDDMDEGGGLGLGHDGSTVLCGDGWGNFTGVGPEDDTAYFAAVKVRYGVDACRAVLIQH